MGRGALIGVCFLLLALAAPTAASSSTVFVVSGRGWGHGVGMSQWGAYGLARHGWSYDRILRHYYRGTKLERTPATTVRVLLAEAARAATIGCAKPFRVTDARGRWLQVAGRAVTVDSRLRVRIRRVVKRHVVRRPVALHPPAIFDCPAAPLVVDGTAYRGRLAVARTGNRLNVVNRLGLEHYLRGVVAGEMPFRWRVEALKAQAVAARTYAVSQLKPAATYDVFADTRDQVYGGLSFETRRTNLAVGQTTGRILTYRGRIITAYYHSTSGGRTAAVQEFFPEREPVPYLVSVPDPHEEGSPHVRWGPLVLTAGRLAARIESPSVTSVAVHRSLSGRVASVAASGPTGRRLLSGRQFEADLGLRSTWFDVGELTLSAGRSAVLFGTPVQVRGAARGLGPAVLERRRAGESWQRVTRLRPGAFALRLQPLETTKYRLRAGEARGVPVGVAVIPSASIQMRSARVLVGRVWPRPQAKVRVDRWTARGWRTVAHPALNVRGRYRTALRLTAGAYRLRVEPSARLAGRTVRMAVTSRALAAARR